MGIRCPTIRAPAGRSRACLDWSERTPHVAGLVGAAIAELFVAKRWVRRLRDSRALSVTDSGRAALAAELGVRIG
jgi:hypothetical protein